MNSLFRVLVREVVDVFGKSKSLATQNANKQTFKHISLHKQLIGSSHWINRTCTRMCKYAQFSSPGGFCTQVKINTPILITHSFCIKKKERKKISTRQILAHMLNFITLFTVSVYSRVCARVSVWQQPSSRHYCSALYCCRNHRWQATFPGRLGTKPPRSARCRRSRLTAIAPDTHKFHIFSLGMRRRREKRRQWKATVIAINCQSHLQPEAQALLHTQSKCTQTLTHIHILQLAWFMKLMDELVTEWKYRENHMNPQNVWNNSSKTNNYKNIYTQTTEASPRLPGAVVSSPCHTAGPSGLCLTFIFYSADGTEAQQCGTMECLRVSAEHLPSDPPGELRSLIIKQFETAFWCRCHCFN